MAIKTIPLSHLEADPRGTLTECADQGQALVVELPDHRLIAIQSLDAVDDDALIDELLKPNEGFREMVARSKAGPRRPFRPDSKVAPDLTE